MNTIKYNSTGHDVDVLQTMLDIPHNSAHEFNKTTYQAVIDFQKRNGLEADGIVGYKTWEALFFHGERPKYGITESDFDRAAMLLDCEPAALKAVQKVETGKRFPVLFLQGSKHRPVFPDKAHAEQQLPTFRLTHPADKARYRVDFNRF